MSLNLLPMLKLLDPYLVITLGAQASEAVIRGIKISKDHGKIFRHAAGFWVIPCYHPGAELYDLRQRDNVEFDAVQIRRFLARKDEFISELRG